MLCAHLSACIYNTYKRIYGLYDILLAKRMCVPINIEMWCVYVEAAGPQNRTQL